MAVQHGPFDVDIGARAPLARAKLRASLRDIADALAAPECTHIRLRLKHLRARIDGRGIRPAAHALQASEVGVDDGPMPIAA